MRSKLLQSAKSTVLLLGIGFTISTVGASAENTLPKAVGHLGPAFNLPQIRDQTPDNIRQLRAQLAQADENLRAFVRESTAATNNANPTARTGLLATSKIQQDQIRATIVLLRQQLLAAMDADKKAKGPPVPEARYKPLFK